MMFEEGSSGLQDYRALSLFVQLAGIYARDGSEAANILAIESIGAGFQAEAAALFYIAEQQAFRLCIAGTHFPIALPEDRWRSIVSAHNPDTQVTRFGPWSLPGFERALQYWLSARLYSAGDLVGYVFLGSDTREWTDQDSAVLAGVADSIAPIAEVRNQKDLEETKRRKAEMLLSRNERRLRDFLEGSPDMIYTVGPDDRITSINIAALGILGRSSKSELLNTPFSLLALDPVDRELLFQRILDRGFVEDFEVVLVRGDGSTIYCLETAYAQHNPDGTLREIQGIVKNISERIESERKLWHTNLELAEANQKLEKTQLLMVQTEKLASIGQLAAGVAHEINNPLSFLISNFSTLERYFNRFDAAWRHIIEGHQESATTIEDAREVASLLSDAREIFEESREGLERIRSIVANLKNFSRIERGQGFEPYDVNAGLENTMAVAWNEIKYVAYVEKKLGQIPVIHARGGEINQVFLNILVNAAQAIAAQKMDQHGKIILETRKVGENVVISIQDDGPGIPNVIQGKVFDPFFTTKEPGKGTGLGMSISYDIVVVKHAGQLWFESGKDGGTTFYISLPIAGPAETATSEPFKS
jgi:PAS domain S-box-containing protein